MDAKLIEKYKWGKDKEDYLAYDIACSKKIPEVNEIALDYDDDIKKLIAIIDISGGNLTNIYKIIIWIEPEYPDVLPYCFEQSNHFSKDQDESKNRHITQEVNYIQNSIKGSFCMVSPFRVPIVFKGCNKDIYNTINLLLVPYLEMQEFYSKNGKFPFGVYSHGFLGLEESLRDAFPGLNDLELFNLLQMGVNGSLKYNAKCFCGSGKKIQNCHNGELIASQNIDFQSIHVNAWLKNIKDTNILGKKNYRINLNRKIPKITYNVDRYSLILRKNSK